MKLYAYDTPATDNARAVIIKLSDEDMARFNVLPKGNGDTNIEVVDQKTGERYKARRHSCGLRCFCGAQLERIK